MTDAQTILKLVETVDPEDTATLDEIDARVWAYLKLNGDFKISFGGRGSVYYRHSSWSEDAQTVLHHHFQHEQYTRSRDALKAIRPEGWMIYEGCQDYLTSAWYCTLVNPKYGGENAVTTGEMLTEELAELHAIIQALEFERGQ